MAAQQQAQQQGPKPYPLTEDFQVLVAALCACRPGFWARVGHMLDPKQLSDARARLVVEAAAEIAKELGRGPDSVVATVQRVALQVNAGKVTLAEMQAARDALMDAQDAGLPEDETVVAQLRPVLAKQMRDQGLREAIRGHATGDIDRALDMLDRSRRVGLSEELGGQEILPDSAFAPFDTPPPPRLTSGIYECDQEIGGGFESGQLIVFGAEPGIGKSMTLNQLAVCATLSGLHVACATLELTEKYWRARYLAGVTDQVIDEVMVPGTEARRAADRELRSLAARGLGRFVFKYFTAEETTLAEIRAWVAFEERRLGLKFSVVITDSLDHVIAPPEISRVHPHHRQVTHVYRAAMDWGRREDRWIYSASQVKTGSQDGKKKAGAQDLSDSAGKGRTTDSLITLKLNEGGEIEGFVAKNRNGRGLVSFGPLPTAYARGQLVPISPMTRQELLSAASLRRIR